MSASRCSGFGQVAPMISATPGRRATTASLRIPRDPRAVIYVRAITFVRNDAHASMIGVMNPVLFKSELVLVLSVTCDVRRSRPGATYHVADTFIALPLRGIFTMHVRRSEHVVHPTLGVVVPADTEYQMSHPNDEGDSGIALRFLPSLVPEALREQPAEVRVTPPDVRMRHALGMLLARIARKDDP